MTGGRHAMRGDRSHANRGAAPAPHNAARVRQPAPRVAAPPPDARHKFRYHRHHARRRGIPFTLTFEDWWSIWARSGKWSERGNHRGRYVMGRLGNRGGYEVGNVRITLFEVNVAEAWKNNPEYRAAQSAANSVRAKRAWQNPEFRAAVIAAQSEAAKRLWQNPKLRAELIAARKIAALCKLSERTAERIAAMRDVTKRRARTPDGRFAKREAAR